MFDRSVRKIVLTVMLALVVFLVGTVSLVYIASFYNVKLENKERLERFSESYVVREDFYGPSEDFQGPNGDMPPGMKPDRPSRDIDMLTVFYSVLYSSDGEVVNVESGNESLHSKEEIESIASSIISKNKRSGTYESMSYLVSDKDGYTLVAFIDNTIVNNNFRTILSIALIGGGIALFLAFFVSLLIAKRIVKPLEENDRRQKQFISDAGHELKTPVSIINANAEILSRSIKDNEWLNNIQYENERMRMLITELLDLSRVESKEVEVKKIDLSRLVTGEVLPFESLAYERGLTIKSEVEDGINIIGNESEFKKLISILLDNAIKYSDGGNTVFVGLKDDHKHAVLEVTNYAKDIDEEKLEHLFERFYRVDEARNSVDGHYGLGLAIAKAICDKHRAKINVTSTDGVVTFSVTFSKE